MFAVSTGDEVRLLGAIVLSGSLIVPNVPPIEAVRSIEELRSGDVGGGDEGRLIGKLSIFFGARL